METEKPKAKSKDVRIARVASFATCLAVALAACPSMVVEAKVVWGCSAPAATNAAPATKTAPAKNAVPALLRPVTLVDAEGMAESGFVDPFRRRGDDGDGGAAASDDDGLMRTTMGEISSEFRILAIVIPHDTNTPRAALIQFHDADEPILVHQGDLVRVDRADGRGRAGIAKGKRPRTSAAGGAARQRKGLAGNGPVGAVRRGNADAELEEQLRRFVFYVNVKNIEPTFIEVYHNKKRPDETIRLNW